METRRAHTEAKQFRLSYVGLSAIICDDYATEGIVLYSTVVKGGHYAPITPLEVLARLEMTPEVA